MVAALDLDDRFAAGVRARRAHRVSGRLGAGVGEPQHVQAEAFFEPFGNLGRDRRWRHEQRADVVQELFDLGDHCGVEVADEHRAETHRQIQHLAVVAVGDVGAARGLHAHRIRIPVLETARDTEWQGLTRPRRVVSGTWGGLGVALPLLGHEGFDPRGVHWGVGNGHLSPTRRIVGGNRRNVCRQAHRDPLQPVGMSCREPIPPAQLRLRKGSRPRESLPHHAVKPVLLQLVAIWGFQCRCLSLCF